MSFSLAHFSDIHLGPLPPGAAWGDFRTKRLLGAVSWHWNRRTIHDPNIANALRDDILASVPDHVAFTGDGVNIGSPREFPPLLDWMQQFGPPDFLSFVPGNHDAYVKTNLTKTLDVLKPYMAGDMRADQMFPYVRLRRNVALIGLNSAIPRGFRSAEGLLGKAQLEALRVRLTELKAKGFYRLIMIHHPPRLGIASKRRGLIDAPQLSQLLGEAGAELIIHGHNHRSEMHWLDHGQARIPTIGVPSGTMSGTIYPAEWNQYTVTRVAGRWHTEISVRRWNAAKQSFQPAGTSEIESAT